MVQRESLKCPEDCCLERDQTLILRKGSPLLRFWNENYVRGLPQAEKVPQPLHVGYLGLQDSRLPASCYTQGLLFKNKRLYIAVKATSTWQLSDVTCICQSQNYAPSNKTNTGRILNTTNNVYSKPTLNTFPTNYVIVDNSIKSLQRLHKFKQRKLHFISLLELTESLSFFFFL